MGKERMGTWPFLRSITIPVPDEMCLTSCRRVSFKPLPLSVRTYAHPDQLAAGATSNQRTHLLRRRQPPQGRLLLSSEYNITHLTTCRVGSLPHNERLPCWSPQKLSIPSSEVGAPRGGREKKKGDVTGWQRRAPASRRRANPMAAGSTSFVGRCGRLASPFPSQRSADAPPHDRATPVHLPHVFPPRIRMCAVLPLRGPLVFGMGCTSSLPPPRHALRVS